MVVIVNRDDRNVGAIALLILLILLIITIVIIAAWLFIIRPALDNLREARANAVTLVECTVAPSAPSISSINAAGNNAIVSWEENGNTDSYLLYMSPDPGFGITLAEREIPVRGTGTTVINLLPITYYFKLVARNSCGLSEVSTEQFVTITEFPSKFKICKRDIPTLCLVIPESNGTSGRVSFTCGNSECELATDGQNISLFPGGTQCLQDNPSGTPIEQAVSSQGCDNGSDQNWTYDFTDFRIRSDNDFCLGADDLAESLAYNTDCQVLSVEDSRYEWVIQPI